jgi:hypothetical protein
VSEERLQEIKDSINLQYKVQEANDLHSFNIFTDEEQELVEEVERLHSIIKELEKELIDVTKFKNNILDDLEKRTLEVNKLRDKLKLKKGGKMKEELQEFNINLEDIEENVYLFNNINEAIEKMKKYTLKDRFEVVLNNNLIETKDKYTGFRAILGCKITYDNLDRNISFIVREDNEPTYEELQDRIDKAIEYIEKQIHRNQQFYEMDKDNLLDILKGSYRNE